MSRSKGIAPVVDGRADDFGKAFAVTAAKLLCKKSPWIVRMQMPELHPLPRSKFSDCHAPTAHQIMSITGSDSRRWELLRLLEQRLAKSHHRDQTPGSVHNRPQALGMSRLPLPIMTLKMGFSVAYEPVSGTFAQNNRENPRFPATRLMLVLSIGKPASVKRGVEYSVSAHRHTAKPPKALRGALRLW
jgi:hypothetical protein